MLKIIPIQTLPIRVIRGVFLRIRSYSAAIAVRNNIWAKLHYTLINCSFNREQHSFLAGRSAYYRSLKKPEGTMALLRRNVHRLEKGILMKPRRIPFALDYIGETLDAYITGSEAQNDGGVDPVELQWGNDVLSKYFDIHSGVEVLKSEQQRFKPFCQNSSQTESRTPYLRDLSNTPPVTFEALRALAKQRRSVRWFLPKSVERDLLDRALEVAVQAPSACNRQPFMFRFFDDPELVQKLINIPFGLAGYGHQVPTVAVVTGQQRHYFEERDRHLIYIDASLAVMGFILSLETLGLSSCCVNWPDIEEKEKKMADLLQLDPDERPVMLIALGYPDPEGMVANSTKKSLSQLRTYNFE